MKILLIKNSQPEYIGGCTVGAEIKNQNNNNQEKQEGKNKEKKKKNTFTKNQRYKESGYNY